MISRLKNDAIPKKESVFIENNRAKETINRKNMILKIIMYFFDVIFFLGVGSKYNSSCIAPMGQRYPQNIRPNSIVKRINNTRPTRAIPSGAPSNPTSPKRMSCNWIGNIGAKTKNPISVDKMRNK